MTAAPPPVRPPVSLVCEGCGQKALPLETAPYPFQCRNAGKDDKDHLVAPVLDPTGAQWPASLTDRPFWDFRRLLHAHTAALHLGLGEEGYAEILGKLQEAVNAVSGASFLRSPLTLSPKLSAALGQPGEVWVKDETHLPSGSHKGRHLFGVLLHLEIIRAAGKEPSPPRPLAIASCGNAALAAAVLARAAGRTLLVMVPPDAHPRVLTSLQDLGARVHTIARAPGELGDPTLTAFRKEVAAGALPFACQGTECGLTLDGGKTLGLEIASGGVPFDRLFIQVGGGALASSVSRALADARALGAMAAIPRTMAVQTEAVAPLSRAYDRLVAEVRKRHTGAPLPPGPSDALADELRSARILPVVHEVLSEMQNHRAAWLPPWPNPQSSRATGILDDETYDALAILRAMLATGGSPVTASEAAILEAEQLGRAATGIDADATGTSGLAGLLAFTRQYPKAQSERSLVLFTGARR